MDTPASVLNLATLLVSATLLWLAAEVAHASRGRRAPFAASVVLIASALWWPVHVLRPADGLLGLTGPVSLFAALPAFAVAACGVAFAKLIERRAIVWLLAVGVLMPAAVYVHLIAGLPGALRAAQGAGLPGVGAVLLLPCAALVALLWPWQAPRRAMVLRGVAAALTAALGFGAVLLSLPIDAPAAPPIDGSAWLMAGALIVMSALVPNAARRAGRTSVALAERAPAALDELTSLPTRLHFERELALVAKKRNGRGLTVYAVDLDRFKLVNDSHGHATGDHVLAQVGQRVKLLQQGPIVAVARLGGDAFVLLVAGVEGEDALGRVAQRINASLVRPYEAGGREVKIGCSIGIALSGERTAPAKLIARADAAMYAAKRAGGARHRFYARGMEGALSDDETDMQADLRRALANDEFELFFQPKIDARSGQVTAAEALLRWNHPQRGVVMPDRFIPQAERSGLISPIGDWVIEAACKQARAWREKGLRMRVAINLSAHQMRQEDLADRIADALRRHRVHPLLLTCEITESAAMEDTSATHETFRRLGTLGVHLSIDDFGTGYSSLAYLRRLPAQELKIDRQFVTDLDHSADARAVVDAVLKLAHALGLKVVAEGVETPRQHEILVELGCDELQGFLFAKPMSARALLLWAIEDRAQSAFRGSLFGETKPVETLAPEARRVQKQA
jgi:diguanylate cyclase (GGDEF)-like protein